MKYDVPRIAEGKYLKLLHELFERTGVLAVDQAGLRKRFCHDCDLKRKCVREGTEGKMSPMCLDGAATMVLRAT